MDEFKKTKEFKTVFGTVITNLTMKQLSPMGNGMAGEAQELIETMLLLTY